jgi:hypothetical protein
LFSASDRRRISDANRKRLNEDNKVKSDVIRIDVSSTRIEGSFFSVAITTPLAAVNVAHIRINDKKDNYSLIQSPRHKYDLG